MFMTVLGTLYSLSGNSLRASQAYPILMFNLILIILLGLYLGYRVYSVLFARSRRGGAPLLHRRFVLIFSLAALVPAILVGAFSTSLITRNINDLFGENVRGNMEQAREILNKYLAQELQGLITEVQFTQEVLNNNAEYLPNRITYAAFLQRVARARNISAVYVLNREGVVLSRAESPESPELEIPISAMFDAMDSNDQVFFKTIDDIDYLIGLTKLKDYDDAYLYVGKYLQSNTGVLSSITGIKDAGTQLDRYNDDQVLLRKTFFLTLLETALLILFAAIWVGFLLANRIIDPLGRLVSAAERIRGGDLTAHVNVEGDWGEMSDLGSAFNRMTRQLNTQREELVREHDISEQRRQFSEAVLSGVRAGVIGLTQEGRITLMNQSAEKLLGKSSVKVINHPIDDILPEFAPAFRSAREDIHGNAEDQVNLDTGDGIRNVDLRVSAYKGARKDTGWVLTFDDMTRLVSAQRHSAWREVARRIAHEIKNPLTPIQLSAERLQRKYGKEIKLDPEVFRNCTETIIRQVGSLEQMVDEFSAFARMPAPVFQRVNINGLIDQVLFEQGVAFPDIQFPFETPAEGHQFANCDARLITQALTNVYKNAGESISRKSVASGNDEQDWRITTTLFAGRGVLQIEIIDNGEGWPMPDKERLLEPYVTTRDTGTGLGLAIVNRIAEDHGGHLSLAERHDGRTGARLIFELPAVDLNQDETKTG